MSYTFLYLSLHFNQSPITDLLLDKIIWYGSLDTIFSSVLTNLVFFYFQFQEILKPNYNSVDLTEVELVDSYNSEPRGNDTQLLAVSIFFISVFHSVEIKQFLCHPDFVRSIVLMIWNFIDFESFKLLKLLFFTRIDFT